MKRTAVSMSALLALLTPLLASAAMGFVERSIWLSESRITEGERVTIYAVLANDDSVAYSGVAHFKDGEKEIGSIPVSLAAGEAKMISLVWTPDSGEHTLEVRLGDASASIQNRTERIDVTVEKKPEAKQENEKDTERMVANKNYTDSKGIQGAVLGVSTTAGNITAPAFEVIDGMRENTSSYLSQKSDEQKTKGQVAGASKSALSDSESDDGKRRSLAFWKYVHIALAHILGAFSFIIAKAGIFYPLFVVLFFLTLWKLYRRFRMPHRSPND